MKDTCQECLWRLPETCRACHQEEQAKPTMLMTRWCMFCHLFIDEVDGEGEVGDSHGLHEECVEAWIAR